MKRIFCFIIVCLLITMSEALATNFIEGFEDVPMMDGLRQDINQDFSFGNEESGYTETLLTAQKNQRFNDVKLFYKGVLPEFGWTLVKESDLWINFTRDGDILEITQQHIRPLKVLISLKSEN